jgi:phenylpropionate dioxygenase-like ring-hydroxylating dioxygenase large terminal subunit
VWCSVVLGVDLVVCVCVRARAGVVWVWLSENEDENLRKTPRLSALCRVSASVNPDLSASCRASSHPFFLTSPS